MQRRRFLASLAAAGGVWLLSGHSPYRQWKLYRQSHLLLFTTRDDEGSDALGEALAARLREALPDSRAGVGRAPNLQRLASLLSSAQADVAVLKTENALALYRGRPPFADFAPMPLRVLVETQGYQLVCRDDFKERHAYLVAEALTREPRAAPVSVPEREGDEAGVPTHAGALAFLRGRALDD
jgi:hypothetical protein